jgi:hypothetical protein
MTRHSKSSVVKNSHLIKTYVSQSPVIQSGGRNPSSHENIHVEAVHRVAKLKERPCQKMGAVRCLSLPREGRKFVVRTGIDRDYNGIAKVDHPKLGELWE